MVAEGATVGAGCSIGPFCVVGPHVVLEDGVSLRAHVVVEGYTHIGAQSQVFPFSVLGTPPQDLKYRGEPSRLTIGARTTVREHVTMNPGTAGGGLETVVGEGGLFMVGCHVAHDCRLGNEIIMANGATLAGHVVVEDFAVIGGLAAVHQFVRIGRYAMVGGMTGIENDVPPFTSALGERGHLAGLNVVGLRRRGFASEDRHALREAYKEVFFGTASETIAQRAEMCAQRYSAESPVQEFLDFVRTDSGRGLTRPRSS